MKGFEVMALINQVAETSSKNEKERILGTAIEDPFFMQIMKAAYDPFVTYGLTPPHVEGEGSIELSADSRPPWTLLNSLANRHTTGNAAREAVHAMMQSMTPQSAELYWRILSKDMRAGFTVNTINRLKKGAIRVFECQLADKYAEKHIDKWPVRVEPKLDGVRVLCLVESGGASFYSRTGKPFPALQHLEKSVLTLVRGAHAKTCVNFPEFWPAVGSAIVLDGEVVSGKFNKTSGDVMRQSEAAEDAVLYLFDALPYHPFMAPERKIPIKFARRREFLQAFDFDQTPDIRLNECYFAHTNDDAVGFYEKFRARGLEGAIVKPMDDIYTKKRTRAWLKMKAEESVDIPIIGAVEGEGKYVGMLGALICNLNGVEVKVGGGLTDQQRIDMWADFKHDTADIVAGPNKLLNRLIEVEYHELTPDGSLRHPRFVGWRDDKDDGSHLEAAE